MATQTKPPIIETAIAGWRDAFAAIAAMPVVAGIAFAILVVLSLLSLAVMPDPMASANSTMVHVIGFVSAIVQSFLLAPLAIAVHRFVLLGEVANSYALDPSSPRYMRFVGFAVLVNVLLLIPNLVIALMGPGTQPTAMSAIVGIVGFVLLIVILIIVLRRMILFPAVAVDAAGATWDNARADTKGNSWRVFFILLCTAVPVMVVSIPLYWLLMRPAGAGTASHIVFSLVSTVIQVPTLCAFAAVASHVFRALADKLAQPATT